MADSSPLAGPLDSAGKVFSLAGELGRDFEQEHRSQGPVFMAGGESSRERHREKINEFIAAVLDLRNAIENPPEGFEIVAEQLRNAGKLAHHFPQLSGRDILDQWPDLNRVAHDGYQAVKEAAKAQRLDDPFAFVDAPAAPSALSLLDRFPATPAGHVAFLEFVRDEVHYAADAKRKQFARDYSNATIKNMVSGIKWAEAGQRVSLLSDLPTDAVEQVARVLRRELTPGTVEQIDELLTPAVCNLRDAYECSKDTSSTAGDILESHRAGEQSDGNHAEIRTASDLCKALDEGKTKTPTKAKRSTVRGEGRVKLIAALTKHHKYADGSSLNLEPVGNNELARLAKVSESTASAFFKKQFGGHTKYRTICPDATRLITSLKLLNQEFSPDNLFGAKPPGEGDCKDEE